MFTNKYDTYDDINFDYYYPYSFEKRNKPYLLDLYSPYKSWNEGDTVEISFDIDKKEETQGRIIVVDFYNFRFEPISLSYTFNADDEIDILIDNKTSKEMFKHGIYFCSVKLEEVQEIEGKEEIVFVKTLIPSSSCYFYVN